MKDLSAVTVKEIKDFLNLDEEKEICFLDIKKSKLDKHRRIDINKFENLKNAVKLAQARYLESKNFCYVFPNDNTNLDVKKVMLIGLLNTYDTNDVKQIDVYNKGHYNFVGFKIKKHK